MRRFFFLLLSFTLVFQGMAFAYSGMSFCAAGSSTTAMHAQDEVMDLCCSGQPGDPGESADASECGSAMGCSVPVAVFADRLVPVDRAVGESPPAHPLSFHSLDIRDVWRPPVTV